MQAYYLFHNEDDIPDYKLQEHNRSKEGVAEEIPFSDAVSFYVIDKYSADNGRPSMDPVMLIKIPFIQYLYGQRV